MDIRHEIGKGGRVDAAVLAGTLGEVLYRQPKHLVAEAEWERLAARIAEETHSARPPHRHAGLEELHLLQGELWIDERKLFAGDYSRSEAPSADKRVGSETGCTCVLVTSTLDVLA